MLLDSLILLTFRLPYTFFRTSTILLRGTAASSRCFAIRLLALLFGIALAADVLARCGTYLARENSAIFRLAFNKSSDPGV